MSFLEHFKQLVQGYDREPRELLDLFYHVSSHVNRLGHVQTQNLVPRLLRMYGQVILFLKALQSDKAERLATLFRELMEKPGMTSILWVLWSVQQVESASLYYRKPLDLLGRRQDRLKAFSTYYDPQEFQLDESDQMLESMDSAETLIDPVEVPDLKSHQLILPDLGNRPPLLIPVSKQKVLFKHKPLDVTYQPELEPECRWEKGVFPLDQTGLLSWDRLDQHQPYLSQASPSYYYWARQEHAGYDDPQSVLAQEQDVVTVLYLM